MLKAVIQLSLVHPYDLSMGTLVEFCGLWDSTIYYGGTQRRIATIAMPSKYFKIIFGSNPRMQSYPVPSGMEHFIESLRVEEIIA